MDALRSSAATNATPSNNGERPHIQVRHLNLWYGEHHALKDVSIDLPDRRIVCVIGPSGCGKTSFLKCLNRMIDLVDGARVQGSVLVDGENLYAPDADVIAIRKKLGLLAQRPYPLPMSIYDNVAYGPRLHGTRKRAALDGIVEQNLRAAGLWDEVKDRLKKPASALSIGQQQRLCLARGLAVEPEVILADEPTSALDPISAKHIEERFLELKQRYTLVIVTHNLRWTKRLADHVLFFYLGELVESGLAKQVLRDPQQVRTQKYLAGEF